MGHRVANRRTGLPCWMRLSTFNFRMEFEKPSLFRNCSVIHGCQPTWTAFFKVCSELGIQQIFASYSNPEGNADTERVIRALKEDLVWPRCLILSPISRRLWMYGKKNIMRIILSHHQVTWRLMNTKDGFIHLPHKRETGGINNSQKMKSAFFDCFYVIAPLKKGVHYTRLSSVIIQKQMCAKLRTLPRCKRSVSKIELHNSFSLGDI